MDVRKAELDTYTEMWGVEDYAICAPAERYVELFASIAKEGSVLDAGCGSGKGAIKLAEAGFSVTMCDLTADGIVPEAVEKFPFVATCLWDSLEPLAYLAKSWYKNGYDGKRFDWVFCSDVLEHIPTEFSMLVVHRLLEVAKKGVFLSIATAPDEFGNWIGKTLHKTVQPFTWWRDNLKELGNLAEARDLFITAIFMVEPKVTL